MADGPPPPRLSTLLSLAWPIVISRSSQVVVGFADAVMVGSLGEAELAATTTGAFNAFFLFILPMGTVFILSSFSSQLFGRGEPRSARRYGAYGLILALASEVVFIGGIPLIGPALSLFSYGPGVAELMAGYLAVRLFSGGFVVGMEALANYYYGLGNTRLPMIANLVAMGLNVALNWILIFGHLGAPALGVAGAAWASVLATLLAFALLLGAFLLGKGVPAPGASDAPAPAEPGVPALPIAATDRLSTREFWQVLRFGIPSGLNWFLEFAAFNLFINLVVAGLGTTELAAMNAVFQVNSMSFMPAFGVASAGAVLVGQAIGGGRHDHAVRAVVLTLLTNGLYQSTVGIGYLLAPEPLMRVFGPEAGSAFVTIGVTMLMLSAAWQLFDAVVTTLAEALRAAGDTAFSMWARVVVAWVLFVPVALLSVRVYGGGVVAAVLSLVGYLGVLAAVLAWRFKSGRWKTISLVPPT